MKKVVFGTFLVVALVSFAVTVFAQAPANGTKPAPAPTVTAPPAVDPDTVISEVDGLKLSNVLLQENNLILSMNQAQEQLTKIREQKQAILQKMIKPGYKLQQNQDQTWGRVKLTPEELAAQAKADADAKKPPVEVKK